VRIQDGAVTFDYLAKGGIRRRQEIIDPAVREVVEALKRRRAGADQLLAYRHRRRWYGVRSDQISEYLKHQVGRRVQRQGLSDLERHRAGRRGPRRRRA
jgi:DNA topoisomerase I